MLKKEHFAFKIFHYGFSVNLEHQVNLLCNHRLAYYRAAMFCFLLIIDSRKSFVVWQKKP